MAKILFNNSDDFPNENKKNEENKPSLESKVEIVKAENVDLTVPSDDFAVFPNWDVVPPDAIINPRLKRKL